jgi:hypothetical protein
MEIMIMKRLYNIAIIAIVSVGAISCNNDLADINQNPNATENPQPAYLLSAVEYH